MIEFKNVNYIHVNGIQALKEINLSIKPKTINALVGSNGTGKTTFLNNINTDIKTQVIYEPVDEWKSIGILQKFYEEPKKYCYLFQSYCLHTRFKLLETIDTSCDFIFIERSIMCDKNVFITRCHENGGQNVTTK